MSKKLRPEQTVYPPTILSTNILNNFIQHLHRYQRLALHIRQLFALLNIEIHEAYHYPNVTFLRGNITFEYKKATRLVSSSRYLHSI